ncbi:hypothetical protein Hanom_Chr15g01412621 [Helianthus anomalus]
MNLGRLMVLQPILSMECSTVINHEQAQAQAQGVVSSTTPPALSNNMTPHVLTAAAKSAAANGAACAPISFTYGSDVSTKTHFTSELPVVSAGVLPASTANAAYATFESQFDTSAESPSSLHGLVANHKHQPLPVVRM